MNERLDKYFIARLYLTKLWFPVAFSYPVSTTLGWILGAVSMQIRFG